MLAIQVSMIYCAISLSFQRLAPAGASSSTLMASFDFQQFFYFTNKSTIWKDFAYINTVVFLFSSMGRVVIAHEAQELNCHELTARGLLLLDRLAVHQ